MRNVDAFTSTSLNPDPCLAACCRQRTRGPVSFGSFGSFVTAFIASASLMLALCAPHAAHAERSHSGNATHYTFAVISGVMTKSEDESAAQRLIGAIGRTPKLSFVVYDGNLRGTHETCADALYDRRHTILAASRTPLVFVPGQRDWISCASAASANVDPLERLDQLRQTFFPEGASLGLHPIALTLESGASHFQSYRENTRWQVGDTVFITLNVPGDNNHYLDAGGRNGEFEDRSIANAFWLNHAGEYAQQHRARAMIIFVEASPFSKSAQHTGRFAWLQQLGRNQPRDGYEEFRHNLVKLAQTFRGPIVLIHASAEPLAHGFLIEQPLHNDRDGKIANVTCIAFRLHAPLSQWLQVDTDATRHPFLKVSVHNVPKSLPLVVASSAPPRHPQPLHISAPPDGDDAIPENGTP